MHPTPVFLPGESQGRGSLEGCRLWGRTESDTIEVTQQQQQQHAHHNNYLGHSFTCYYFTVSLNHFCIVDFLLRDRQVFTFLLLDNYDCSIILVYIFEEFLYGKNQKWYLSEKSESVSPSASSDSENPWTGACQAPLSMNFPGKNTGVGSHSLLQGIFPTKGLNLGLPHWRQIYRHLSYQGSPINSMSPHFFTHTLWI